ncbi:phosphopantetheine attachment domain protein [Spongiactinospora gelatinilytica]|uniref:Phosphopantetheine attachment domain protein n=1 Tax=Spongiactinospora gelatinilytica TaxID=2666298 RepID=A0A2W2FAN4_9ACTN|nr:acyl carrier protein [Spongiactinospora gelatinilytica]PZG34326.1 phosphopantetheine attachment domain protein [Spongiactinospora gelatinilytica]
MSQILTDQDLRTLLIAVGLSPGVPDESLALTFEELDLDSLARMEIATRIQEKFGVDVEDDLVAETSPQQAKHLVNQRLESAA